MNTADYFSPDGIQDDVIDIDYVPCDDDTNREDKEEKPFEYSPFSPYYTENK